MTIDYFPLIEVSGDAYQRGWSHGAQARDRVHRSVAIYAKSLDRLTFCDSQLRTLLDGFTCEIERFDASYIDEMRGIADGAGVSFDDVLMINARTEIMAQAAQSVERGADECTSVGVFPRRSASGTYFQGQNWDNRVDCADTIILLRIIREDGPDVLTFVEAGGLARYGLNSAGICLNGNGLNCDRDYCQPGIPLPLIRRKALEQEHFSRAVQIIYAAPKACSSNLLLGSRLGVAFNLECAPDETFLVYPQNGLAVHANHWVSATALAKLRETGVPGSPDSIFRYLRVAELLEASSLSVEDVKAAFADTLGHPYSVCRPPRASDKGYQSSTTATMIMNPDLGVIEVARMPSGGAHFVRYPIERGAAIQL